MNDLSRRVFLTTPAALAPAIAVPAPGGTPAAREYWVRMLTRIAGPVLSALGRRKLKADMPVEAPHGNTTDRAQYTHLEALGRLLSGMAPWLETCARSSDECARYAELARQAIAAAVDPASPDFMNFSHGSQPVVDAAFLALGLLRARSELWEKLPGRTKAQTLDALRSTRVIRPGFNNWLLFSATIEAFFAVGGQPWDSMRVDYALRQHEEWYKGDGLYGDGPEFHWDYYNSFVIQPMLLAVCDAVAAPVPAWLELQTGFRKRAQRYAVIEERLIAPDGSYPAIGRSLAYRCGAFHLLADVTLRRELPATLAPGQARAALEAVIRRTLDADGTFTSAGWLQVGLCGHQPSIAEAYISTGSLYLCANAFLPLGLPAEDPFWTEPNRRWTSQRVWSGEDVAADHAMPANH